MAVLTRMLIDQRNAAAFAEKRLALDPELTEVVRLPTCIRQLARGVPRTIVMLDEAQSFLLPNEA